MSPMSEPETLQAYLDGELATEQAAALQARLRTDPRLADTLVRLARDEAVLNEWGRSAFAVQALDTGTTPSPVFLPIPTAIPVVEPARPQRRRRLILLFVATAAAAAVLLAFLGINLHRRPGAEPAGPEMARVEEVQGEVFVVPEKGEPYPAKSGQKIASGQGLSTRGDGYAVLAVTNTWRLEVGADTTIRLPAESPGERVYLEQGIVAFDVGPQPSDRPMIVATPHAEARLSAAKSSFASTPVETRIEPEKGKVRLMRKSDGRAIDVGSGEYAVAAGATDSFAPQRMPTQVTEPRFILTEVSGQAITAAYNADGATLAVGCLDGSIKLWEPARAAVRLTLPGAKRAVRALAFAPVGNMLAAAYDDRTVKLWDPVTGTELTTLKDFRSSVGSLAFALNGTLLATGGNPGKGTGDLRLWDTKTWKEIPLPREQTGNAGAVAFSPEKNNPTLAVVGKDNIVRLWDVNLRQVRQTLGPAGPRLSAIAFAPDGRLLVGGGKDRSVRLWDPANGKEVRSFPVACCEVRSLAFAADGKLAVAADHNVVLWDLSAGRERLTLKGGKHAVGSVLFAPNGKTLVTLGGDRVIRFWDATPPEMPRPGL